MDECPWGISVAEQCTAFDEDKRHAVLLRKSSNTEGNRERKTRIEGKHWRDSIGRKLDIDCA